MRGHIYYGRQLAVGAQIHKGFHITLGKHISFGHQFCKQARTQVLGNRPKTARNKVSVFKYVLARIQVQDFIDSEASRKAVGFSFRKAGSCTKVIKSKMARFIGFGFQLGIGKHEQFGLQLV